MHSVFFFKNPCPWVRFWYVSHSLLHCLSFSCIFLSFDMLSITFSAFSRVPVYQIHQAHCRQLWLPRITWSNSSVARLRSNLCISSQPNEFQYYYIKHLDFSIIGLGYLCFLFSLLFCSSSDWKCFQRGYHQQFQELSRESNSTENARYIHYIHHRGSSMFQADPFRSSRSSRLRFLHFYKSYSYKLHDLHEVLWVVLFGFFFICRRSRVVIHLCRPTPGKELRRWRFQADEVCVVFGRRKAFRFSGCKTNPPNPFHPWTPQFYHVKHHFKS